MEEKEIQVIENKELVSAPEDASVAGYMMRVIQESAREKTLLAQVPFEPLKDYANLQPGKSVSLTVIDDVTNYFNFLREEEESVMTKIRLLRKLEHELIAEHGYEDFLGDIGKPVRKEMIFLQAELNSIQKHRIKFTGVISKTQSSLIETDKHNRLMSGRTYGPRPDVSATLKHTTSDDGSSKQSYELNAFSMEEDF